MKFIIDVHCHTFNACDIPVKGFVDSRAPKFIAVILDKIFQGIAPEDKLIHDEHEMEDLSDEEIHFILRKILEENDSIRAIYKHEMMGSLDEDALLGLDKIGALRRYIKWAKLLTKSRDTITNKLLKTYPEVHLFTPLMMDMEHWFNDSVKTLIPDQVRLFEKLVKKNNGKIHPFIAFDPKREWLDPGGPNGSMALIQDAVINRGFIGVKVYPPMGYRPAGNINISPAIEHAADYDRLFDLLFDFCEKNEIPITTHCTNGGAEAKKGSGIHADPEFWKPVLEKHNKLYVNFAHFGGDKDLVTHKENSWAYKIAGLMDQYDNVYADTGHHSICFDDKLRDAFFIQLKQLYKIFPKAKKRLMFGTDSHMIVRTKDYKKFFKRYLNAYSDHFSESETNLFIGQNAVKFLGLQPGGKNRERLYQFYTRNELQFPQWWIS